MKRAVLTIMALVFNALLFSCIDDSVEETDALYENATEGDNGHVEEEREYK